MNKKSQVAVFIIISVFVILLFGLMFYVYSKGYLSEYGKFFFSRNSIINYVSDSVVFTLDDALYVIGLQGGYLNITNEAKLSKSSTSYLYYNNQSYIPSINELEDDISKYIDENLKNYLNFDPFVERGYLIDSSNPKTDVTIVANGIIVDLNMRVDVTREESVITVSDFKVKKEDIRLPYILNTIKEIVDFNKDHLMAVDMTMLDEYDMDFSVVPMNYTLIYKITDPQSIVKENSYNFWFGVS